jgi:hypothetical protein
MSNDNQSLIGQKYETVKDQIIWSGRIRVWHPDTMGTADNRMDRLNVSVDADGTIDKIWIG